ncbi:MAG: penicillin acylase family protein [Aeromicrobium sp.]|nr:penicillin acylase family protein [Burkholderiales bacterium]
MSFQSRDTRLLRWLKFLLVAAGGIALIIAAVAIGLFFVVRASVPILDGDKPLANLENAVSITRDANGMVSITADTSRDAIRALGYVHGQERFFEMDLARRSAAGELSALLGSATLPMDKLKRVHRLRAKATAEFASAQTAERAWYTAYTEGVNAGVAALGARPWQYLVLRAEPTPWREEDSLLVVAEMYSMLQAGGVESRFTDIRLRKRLGDKLFDWMRPQGGPWDATLDAFTPPMAALPTADDIDLRRVRSAQSVKSVKYGKAASLPPVSAHVPTQMVAPGEVADQYLGSNNWAVSGLRTADGRAILADDMHLGLSAPGIWFRAQMTFNQNGKPLRVVGMTLPGVPQITAGSNGHIAWGYTNNYGQFFDWVSLPKVGASPLAIRTTIETISVKGGDAVTLEVKETDVGPILKSDAEHHYALSWVLYRRGALVNHVAGFMFATELDAAIKIAHNVPMPHQNILIADNLGGIAWTVAGRIPERPQWRVSRGTTTPVDQLPTGWLDSSKYPVIKNPVDGLLWTANSKQLGGAGSEIIGDGGFDLGARAMQIRDRLRETEKHTEQTLYAIQLDRESRFLKRWAALAVTRGTAPSTPPPIAALVSTLKAWNGAADVAQVGHRVARAFREQVQNELWRAWLASRSANTSANTSATTNVNTNTNTAAVDALEKSDASLSHDARFEYAAWQAIEAEAPHLLPKGYLSWPQFLDAQLVRVHDELIKQHGSLDNATWGSRNMSRIKHPFSRAMPFLSPYLDMPSRPLAGDNHMPRDAAPSFGASQRLVVSPGKEEQGILTVAGGQSGHPLSPFYGAGHQQWVDGAPLALLAGPPKHTLTLAPRR